MSSYQISDLEKLTGIKAHTLRVWERRYGLIEPHRTATNIRYYDDEQARKLLKVSTLLAQGLRISHISALSEKQMNAQIRELQRSGPEDVICTGFVNDLAAAMLGFDEAAFEKAFSSALNRFGMYQAMLRVFYPFLHKTGVLWSLEEAMPVQEHFASALIRRKLIAAIDGLPPATRRSKLFLLFLPPGEWHETGLLLSDYIIRAAGYKTIYLGQDVPAQNLSAVIKSTKPTHLLSLYIARREPEKTEEEIKGLAKANPTLQMLVAGSHPFGSGVKKSKNVIILSDPQALVNLL